MRENCFMNKKQYLEYEIDLMEYLKISVKRKWTVLGIFLVCILLGTIITLSMPKVYEVSQILSLPVSAKNGYIDSAKIISRDITAGGYDSQIRKKLKLSPDNFFKFKVQSRKGTKFIKISLEVRKEEVNRAEKILDELFRQMEKEYAEVIKNKKQKIEIKISLQEITLAGIELEKLQKKKSISTALKQIERNKSRINFLETNISLFDKKIDSLSREKPDEISFLEAVVGMNQLRSDLDLLKKDNEYLKIEIEQLKFAEKNQLPDRIFNYKHTLNGLKMEKELIQNIKQVQPPFKSNIPVKPRNKTNITIAVFIGLILGVLGAVLKEFLGKSRASTA